MRVTLGMKSLDGEMESVEGSLTVTHLDSLVLARCGFNHSADYRSVMAFGTNGSVLMKLLTAGFSSPGSAKTTASGIPEDVGFASG